MDSELRIIKEFEAAAKCQKLVKYYKNRLEFPKYHYYDSD